MKQFFSLTITLLFLLFLYNIKSQELSDSLKQIKMEEALDSLAKVRADSLRAANEATIKHIKEIFSKSKKKRPTIGLALAGGGAKGFAHAGVLQLIDSLDIPVDYIAGNSMGGLVAALYSIGYSGKDLEKYAINLNWNKLLNDNTAREQLPFIEKKKTGMYQLTVGLKGYQPTVPSGIIYGQNIQMEFLSVTAPFEDVNNFDDLPIPYRCVAVDLVTGKEEILKSGSLSKAMRATMSIPSAFSPVDWNNYLLVDGMVLNNFPVDVVKAMGADIVIGLNLTTGRMEKEDLTDFLSVLNRSVDIPTGGRLKENIKLSDIYVSQNMNGFSTSDFDPEKITAIVERGKEASRRNLDVFISLKNELEKYDDYQEWKRVGKAKKREEIKERKENFILTPPTIENISIVGNKKFESDFIKDYLRIREGDVFTTKSVQQKIEELYALNYFETVTYEITKVDKNRINLQINVKEKPVNKIVAGFKYNDHFKLVGLIGLEINSAFIQGAQLETYIKFGGLTLFDLTALYPSRSMDIPIYPFLKVSYKEVPINFYFEGRKYFSFRDRSWAFMGGLNFSLSKFWNLEASLKYESMNVVSDIASSDIEELISYAQPDANIVAGNLHLLYDSLDDIIIPNSGWYFKFKSEISMKDLGSELQYHKLESVFRYYLPISKKHNFSFIGLYAYASEGTEFYKWFYLGGQETFVGIDYYQAHGTEFTIGQVGYRYQFLKDLYISGKFNMLFNYNLSYNEFSKRGDPIIGAGISLIMRTIFGKAELMFSRGDKNLYAPGKKSNKIYFTFGYNLK